MHDTQTRYSAEQRAEFKAFEQRLAAIQTMGPDENGYFGPRSLSWEVSREAVLIATGMRPLLLQVAHPAVAAAVAQYSDFKNAPYARGFRTFEAVYGIVFGTRSEADDIGKKIFRIHQMIRGYMGNGQPYSAVDPEALLWVHATLIDSAMRGFSALVRPLSDLEKADYYQESIVFAQLFGVPLEMIPPDYSAFVHYMQEMIEGDTIRWTADGLAVAKALMHGAPKSLAPAAYLYNVLGLQDVPEHLRDAVWNWSKRDEAMATMFKASLRTMIGAMPESTSSLRWVPDARAAFASRKPGDTLLDWASRVDQMLLPVVQNVAQKFSLT